MVASSDDDGRTIDDERFRALLDGAYDGLFIIDPETGDLADANRTVCEWLGYSQEDVREMTIFDCQATFSEPSEWQEFVQEVREKDGVQIANEIVTRDGSKIPVEGSISVVSVDGDEHVVAIPRKVSN